MSGATANARIKEWEPRRDRPLCFHWKAVDIDWIRSLDLPLPRNFKHAEARASVLLEALLTNLVAPGQWVSYSRRKEWWSNGTRYRGTSYSYATVLPAVDELTAVGLLQHDRKVPGNLGWQSRFRATPTLQQTVKIPTVIYDPVELIRLKDRDDKLIDYRDTNNTISMRRRLEEINEALSAADLELYAPTVKHDGMLLRVGNDHVLYPAMRTLYRIFNRGSFSNGGRFYGTWWQQIPKKIRPQLLIDGEPTIEHDYPQLHPNMLYAEIGARLEGDAYAVDGWPRNLVKVAFNILVNAENHGSALRAIALEIGGEGAYARATSLIEAIKLRHPTITRVFHSDAGIRLQRRDADMAETIMSRLIRFGIVVLPIHDSFITAARHGGALVEAMNFAWARCYGGEGLVISISYDINDPQKERLEEPGLPSLFVARLPWSPLPDLFGGRPLPRRDLEAWSSGFMPLALRAYLRDEVKARGLRQSDVALSLGISRTQLVNILRGRFGAGPRVTEDLKALAACLDAEIDDLALHQHRERQIEKTGR
jgi:hypothetical protein